MSTLNSVSDVTANRLMVFNSLPITTCNSQDFDPGATINTTELISYTSSNANVAVIIDAKIRITGAGTSVITAAACDNLNYPAKKLKVTQLLTVKEPECIKPECRVVEFNKGITKVLKTASKI